MILSSLGKLESCFDRCLLPSLTLYPPTPSFLSSQEALNTVGMRWAAEGEAGCNKCTVVQNLPPHVVGPRPLDKSLLLNWSGKYVGLPSYEQCSINFNAKRGEGEGVLLGSFPRYTLILAYLFFFQQFRDIKHKTRHNSNCEGLTYLNLEEANCRLRWHLAHKHTQKRSSLWAWIVHFLK